jgi:filamentous hemagglutinin
LSTAAEGSVAPTTFRDSAGRLRNADGTFAFDGGTQAGGLQRPSLSADTRAAIEANARKNAAGQFIDSKGNVITEWHYGHIRGHENRRIIAAAEELGLSQSQLNDYVNARPQLFKIEDKARNLSHVDELPGKDQLGPILRDMRNYFAIDR